VYSEESSFLGPASKFNLGEIMSPATFSNAEIWWVEIEKWPPRTYAWRNQDEKEEGSGEWRPNLQRLGGELDADSRLGVEGEVVASEAGEDVGLADAAVPDQNHLEQVWVLVIHLPTHRSAPPLLSCFTMSSVRGDGGILRRPSGEPREARRRIGDGRRKEES
jgi:hypothetical protein